MRRRRRRATKAGGRLGDPPAGPVIAAVKSTAAQPMSGASSSGETFFSVLREKRGRGCGVLREVESEGAPHRDDAPSHHIRVSEGRR